MSQSLKRAEQTDLTSALAASGVTMLLLLARAYRSLNKRDRTLAGALLLFGLGSILDLSGRTVMRRDFTVRLPERTPGPVTRPDAEVVLGDMVAVARRPEFLP